MCTEERTFGESQRSMEQTEQQQNMQPQENTQEGREVNMNKEEKEHEANTTQKQGEKESEHNEDGREQKGNVDMEEQETDQQEHEQIIGTECIVQISDENTPEEMLSSQLKTKLCSAILKALGTDALEDLLVLDTLRHKMKQQSVHLTAQCVSRYKQLVAMYREKLIDEEGRLKASITEFETAFYHTHNCLPDVIEVEEYRRLTSQNVSSENLYNLRSSLDNYIHRNSIYCTSIYMYMYHPT